MSGFPNLEISSLPLTFLLCDPELDLGSLNHRDVCYDITSLDDSSIVSAIRGCVRSRIKYLVYKNTLEDLLSRDKVFSFLRDKSIPLCYSFSLSHTYEQFRDLASRGLPQVGCCYLYDRADADGVLFDDSSVSMRLSTNDSSRGVVTNPGHKSVIELTSKCNISPLDPSSQSIKVNQILSGPLVIMHAKILEFRFSLSFWVERAEVAMEFGNEFGVIGEPGDINSGGQGGFKPVQCSPFEIGQGIGNLSAVISKQVRPVIKTYIKEYF